MKNLKFLFLLVILPIIGCSDLEEEPVSLLSPDGFFKSTQDVQTAINGAYGNMAEEAFWGRKLSLPLLLRSDMAVIGDQGTAARRKDHDNFTVTADNGMITAFWPRSYQIIAAANEAIAGAESLGAPNETINPIVAQAYFVRAFTYFHLVRLFGDIPYLDKPVTDIEAAKVITKSTEAEVYNNIIADLQFAKTWLPNKQTARSLPSKGSASAYLADVYLHMGDYPKAYLEAKDCINNEAVYGFDLDADFQNLFNFATQNASPEPIFTLDYQGNNDGNFGQDFLPALTGIRADDRGLITGGGWSVAVPSLEVYNRWDGRDYRKAVSLDTVATFGGVPDTFMNFPIYDGRNIQSAYIAKYGRFVGPQNGGNGRASSFNYAMMRYAEVLLIAAEALNERTPGTTEADGYVNRVRARARNSNGVTSGIYPLNVIPNMSQADFRDMVLEERRLELAFEAKRWYDIKRRQLGDNVFSASGLEVRPNFSASRDYLLPLPNDELQRNTNLQPNNQGYN